MLFNGSISTVKSAVTNRAESVINTNDYVRSSGNRRRQSIKSIDLNKYDKYDKTTKNTRNTEHSKDNKIEKLDSIGDKVVVNLTLGEIVKEVSDIKLKYNEDLQYLLDDLKSGDLEKGEVVDEIIKFHRNHNINAEMTMNKLIFVIVFIGIEVVAVRFGGLKDLKGIASYMCGKMPNFIEFMHFMASENVDEENILVKDSNYHYRKLVKVMFLEFIIFISASMCSNGTILNSDIIDNISSITINDVKGSPADNMTGYLASMVTGFLTKETGKDGTDTGHDL